jgi:endonuclease/exonuclease/phosphatase family metal-dependent hydrolase
LDGDNSDYDFDSTGQLVDNGRLDNTYRLATYNTHRCAPPNTNVSNYDLTAKAISLIDADVIALQELDEYTTTHPTSQIKELADRTGLNGYFCKTIDYRGGDYGIGILSRTEPIKTYSGELPGVEPRKFFVCEFENFVFICTHLCVSSSDNRLWSFDLITDYVATNYGNLDKPVYLAGDLNTTTLPSTFTASWKSLGATTPTYPSSSKRIDYILVYTGNNAAYSFNRTFIPVYTEIQLSSVSDHNPVIVDMNN